MSENKNIRYFIDLDFKGNGAGGVFVECKKLKKEIEKLEKDKNIKVIGVAYDGTDNLEIVTSKTKQK